MNKLPTIGDKPVFVTSIMRVKNYNGEECEPIQEFAGHDINGQFCFGPLQNAMMSFNMDDAEQEFRVWWTGFKHYHPNYEKYFDMNTLCIKKQELSTTLKMLADELNGDMNTLCVKSRR